MVNVVAGLAVSHSSMMITNPDLVDDDQRTRVYDAYERAAELVTSRGFDRVVMFGTDHFNSFFLDHLPQICVGIAAQFDGWADNVPPMSAPGDAALGRHLAESLVERDFDVALSHSLRLDHSFFAPLSLLVPGLDVPIVPIVVNTLVEPMISMRRAYELGRAVGASLRGAPGDERILIVGSGGLSHWIGLKEQGTVNAQFDRSFIDHLCALDVEWLTSLTSERIEAEAGNGGQEIRTLVAARAAVGEASATSVFYEPVHGWLAGYSVIAMLSDSQ